MKLLKDKDYENCPVLMIWKVLYFQKNPQKDFFLPEESRQYLSWYELSIDLKSGFEFEEFLIFCD